MQDRNDETMASLSDDLEDLMDKIEMQVASPACHARRGLLLDSLCDC